MDTISANSRGSRITVRPYSSLGVVARLRRGVGSDSWVKKDEWIE